MTVWYESALLPPVAGAEEPPSVDVTLPQSPRRYTQPYSPPSHGANASSVKSPRRHVNLAGGSEGAAQPWWWPGAQAASARGSGKNAGSLAARLTQERLGSVHGGHTSSGTLLARTTKADLMGPPAEPPPRVHHGGPVYCNPSLTAKELDSVRPMKRDAPSMRFAFVAAVAHAAASHDTTGLTKIGLGEMLMNRKFKRRKMQKGKHSAVWESCGSPRAVADGEGVALTDQRQAIAIATARSGEILVAIPGKAHEQAAEAADGGLEAWRRRSRRRCDSASLKRNRRSSVSPFGVVSVRLRSTTASEPTLANSGAAAVPAAGCCSRHIAASLPRGDRKTAPYWLTAISRPLVVSRSITICVMPAAPLIRRQSTQSVYPAAPTGESLGEPAPVARLPPPRPRSPRI